MKRTRNIRLLFISGISAGALSSCGPGQSSRATISPQAVYTNNYYVPGAGYYHAPFRGWYQLPYNHFDPGTGRYFYGGRWAETRHESIINISSPTPEMAQQAQAVRTDVRRSGFGSTSRHHSTWS